MRVVVQRVCSASVTVSAECCRETAVGVAVDSVAMDSGDAAAETECRCDVPAEADCREDAAEDYRREIGPGMLVLCAFEESDTEADLDWMVRKLCALRIFDDENGVMNRSIGEAGGEILLVSQFTLYASTAKGNRPSYIRAARPETAIPLYESFIRKLRRESGLPVPTGIFGADMRVELVNDGPVTILIDSKEKW